MTSPVKEHLARLSWACRRGMLELDFLLQKFFNSQYLNLSAHDQQLFEKLLECNDQDLYMWLVKKNVPEDVELQKIVKMIWSLFSLSGT